jgi:hypothetical protein
MPKYDYSTVSREALETMAALLEPDRMSAADCDAAEAALAQVRAEATKLPSTDAEILAEVCKHFTSAHDLYVGLMDRRDAQYLAKVLGLVEN